MNSKGSCNSRARNYLLDLSSFSTFLLCSYILNKENISHSFIHQELTVQTQHYVQNVSLAILMVMLFFKDLIKPKYNVDRYYQYCQQKLGHSVIHCLFTQVFFFFKFILYIYLFTEDSQLKHDILCIWRVLVKYLYKVYQIKRSVSEWVVLNIFHTCG